MRLACVRPPVPRPPDRQPAAVRRGRALLLALPLLGALAAPLSAAEPFPARGLLPKAETGAVRFLQEHPRHDGRGVVVAIFDTGVDPGAPGLQVTADGKPKILDVVDGSGSGDVDTSTVVRAERREIDGLSGRTLSLGRWRSPSDEYHVGLKPAFELFPRGLVSRLRRERRREWDELQRREEVELARRLADHERRHPDPGPGAEALREDLELQLELLADLQESYEDPGPVLDCVVFHDGKTWRAVIDTDEDGDLSDERALASYREEREHATFGDEDLLNFAVNVYDDGDLLSIVVDTGAHGTHVAGIVAGHFPDQPEMDGLAPGAQVVSVKIGDTRIGSSSLGTGEVRGLVAVLRNRCDVINMSYGGSSAHPDRGRFAALYSEIVNEHGVIFVASAGNSGPALSTVGTPGATTSGLYGVGAFVSPDMMRAGYGLLEELPETQFTWSSAGPTLDGALGVAFSAPGGAIAPVPNWVLQRNMLMNGTSMSSPNVAGNVALLVSALRARDVPFSPHSVRRALEATARPVPGVEPFALGQGLIQVDRAFEHLLRTAGRDDVGVRYEVAVSGTRGRRGIYLREPGDVARVHQARVRVSPRFREEADKERLVEFQRRLALSCDAAWVKVPDFLLLMHGGRSFDVRVDPTALPDGVHHATIVGHDADDRAAGPVVRVPVTVIRPRSVTAGEAPALRETLTLHPGRIVRRFLAVPEGTTWADVAVRSLGAGESRRLVLHAVQLLPERSFSHRSLRQYLTLEPGETEVRSLALEGGRTLEVTLAQYWSSLGATEAEIEVQLHGLAPEPSELLLGAADLTGRVDVTAALRREIVEPRAKLETLRRTLRPERAEPRPLDPERDLLPDGRQVHELVLTYALDLGEEATVRPRLSLAPHDDVFGSGLWMLHDAAGRRVGVGLSGRGEVELAKGAYSLRFHVRHEDPALLRDVAAAPAVVDLELAKAVVLSAHEDLDAALTGARELGRRQLEAGERLAVFFAAPSDEKRPAVAAPGDELVGTMTFGDEDRARFGAGARPSGFPVRWLVPAAAPPSDDGGEDGEASGGESEAEEDTPTVRERLRDARVGVLEELSAAGREDEMKELADELLSEDPQDLRVLRALLAWTDGDARDDHLEDVVAAAVAVLEAVDLDALAAWQGLHREAEDAAAERLAEEMKTRREAVVDALFRRARALADLHEASPRRHDAAAFQAAHERLAAWREKPNDDQRRLAVRYERSRGRPGAALKALDELIDGAEEPSRDLRTLRGELLAELGWDHWARHERRWSLIRFPPGPPPPF